MIPLNERRPKRQIWTIRVAALFEANPAVFSFVFGIPSPEILRTCKQKGIVTAGCASTMTRSLPHMRTNRSRIWNAIRRQ